MSKTDDPITADDDKKAFQDAMQGVTPLKSEQRVAIEKPSPRARQRNPARTPAAVPSFTRMEAGAQAAESYQAPGVQHRIARQLRRGKISIEDRVDLHGLHLKDAHEYLHQFIEQCLARQLKHVLVIHGKGLSSGEQGPVLKPNVRHWLQQHAKVAAYTVALPKDGGSGALYVQLKTG